MKILLYVAGFIIFCFAGFFLVGAVVPRVEFKNEVEVNRSDSACWKVFTEPSLTAQWMEGFQEFEKIKGEPLSDSSEYAIHFGKSGQEYKIIEKVRRVVVQKEFSFLAQTTLFEDEVSIRFESLGPYQTRIISQHVVQANHWFMRSLFVFMKSTLQQADQETMLRLKKLIETDIIVKPTNK